MSDEPTRQLGREPPAPFSTTANILDTLIEAGVLERSDKQGVRAMLGRFEVLSLVGLGGMGICLKARDPEKDALVAVKILRPEMVHTSGAVHRFLKEGWHMQQMSHPNILKVTEVSNLTQVPYFVTPFMARGSLSGLIGPKRPLDQKTVLNVCQAIARALCYAHSRGIIHRDLKPANILLGDRGEICLSDFGLGQTFYNDSVIDAQTSFCEGTPPYMSPAVAAGEAEDTRCDIYSFGALMYELLTGRPPYTGSAVMEIIQKILAGPPTPILELNPQASTAFVVIAEGAMERELRDRYAHMDDVLADLDRIRDGIPPLGPHGQISSNFHFRPSALRQTVGERYELWDEVPVLDNLQVFEGLDRTDQRPVWLKCPSRDFCALSDEKAAVAAEPAGQKQLTQPHIVPFRDVVDEGPGLPIWLVTDRVKGKRLSELMHRRDALETERALVIGVQIAEALEFAHTRPHPVVHGDLNPHNVIVHESDWVWLVDFAVDLMVKKAMLALGKVESPRALLYLAPELFAREAKAADRRADVYSFGAILYEMLAGDPPYDNATDVLAAKRTRAYLPLQQHCPSVAPELVQMVERCLSPEPEERYAGMGEVIKVLKALADGLTFPARPVDVQPNAAAMSGEMLAVGLGQPARKRRSPLVASALGALAAVLAVGIWVFRAPLLSTVSRWTAPAGSDQLGAGAQDEPAAWETAARRDTLAAYKDYLQRFPEGVHARKAEARVGELTEEENWRTAMERNTLESYATYKTLHPYGAHASEADRRSRAVREEQEWQAAAKNDTEQGYAAFLEKYPEGQHAAEAKTRRDALADVRKQALQRADEKAWKEAADTGTVASVKAYLEAYPEGVHVKAAREQLASLEEKRDWAQAVAASTSQAYSAYLAAHEKGAHAADAAARKRLLEDAATDEARLAEWGRSIAGRKWTFAEGRIAETVAALKGVGDALRKDDVETARKTVDGARGVCDMLGRVLPVPSWAGVSDAQVRYAVEKGLPVARVVDLGEGRALRLVLVAPGSFTMGSADGFPNERPPRTVQISRPFYMSVTEITNGQFNRFLAAGGDTGRPAGLQPVADKDDLPRVQVSWQDAVRFCEWASELSKLEVRLPTEAEWEYACRAGSTTAYCFGDAPEQLDQYAWFKDNFQFALHAVGLKRPNAWGLSDMHGNVAEWCRDWYSDYPESGSAADPAGPGTGDERVVRGGVMFQPARNVRSSYRDKDAPTVRNNDYGFRVVVAVR